MSHPCCPVLFLAKPPLTWALVSCIELATQLTPYSPTCWLPPCISHYCQLRVGVLCTITLSPVILHSFRSIKLTSVHYTRQPLLKSTNSPTSIFLTSHIFTQAAGSPSLLIESCTPHMSPPFAPTPLV